jgi:hypothetical protein
MLVAFCLSTASLLKDGQGRATENPKGSRSGSEKCGDELGRHHGHSEKKGKLRAEYFARIMD